VLVENDPFFSFPDRTRLEKAFQGLDLLVVLDYLDSMSAKDADVFLPTATLYEAGGFFINQEARAQKAAPAFRGGRPIFQTGGGSHPPRFFSKDIPGHDARPAWQALAELGPGTSGSFDKEARIELMQWLVEAHPMFSDLLSGDPFPEAGVRLNPGKDMAVRVQHDVTDSPQSGIKADKDLELITVDWTFGTEELSVRSPYLRQVEKEPCLFLSEIDAARLGISRGDRVALQTDAGTVEVHAALAGNMARGILVLPRHHRLPWQHLQALKIRLNHNQILKIDEDS
jgi:NADH-quinone oxidoreductase subunit G